MTRRVFTICLWAGLLVCALEVACRTVLFPQYTAMLPRMYATHPVIGYFNRPNIEVRRFNPMNYDVINHTNSLGLRGLERNREKELAGVWVCGASNTFGGYVEDDELFSARLRNRGYWAANLASENHRIDQQVLVIRYLAQLGYRPRAVILGLPMFHGIRDYSDKYDAFTRSLDADLQSEARNRTSARDNLASGLHDFAYAFPWSYQALRVKLLKSSAIYGWFKVGVMGIPALRSWTLEAGLRKDIDFATNFDIGLMRPLNAANPARKNIESTADYIAAMAAMVREKFGVPFGVVVLPAHLQLHPDSFRRFAEHYGIAGDDLDPVRPSTALVAALAARGVPVIDTLPALQDSGISRKTFPDDGHLIPASHAVVATAVADWLHGTLGLDGAVGGGK